MYGIIETLPQYTVSSCEIRSTSVPGHAVTKGFPKLCYFVFGFNEPTRNMG